VKSFPTDIKVHGIRVEASNPKNKGFSLTCKNMRAHKWGLEGYIPNYNSLPKIVYGGGSLDLSYDWPFPQVFHTDTGLWIGKRDGLYKATVVLGVWTATKIASTSCTWPWTVANSPLFPVFANGEYLVYYDYGSTAWICYDGTSAHGTLWNHNWLPPMSTLFHYGQILTVGALKAGGTVSQSRILRWSEIGAFRFLGNTANPLTNDSGYWYAPVDNNEIILRAMSLGKNIILYGTFSTYVLQFAETPAPTYSFRLLKNVGIANPIAVGGDNKKHLMIDRNSNLWKIEANDLEKVGLEYIGYSDALKSLQTIIEPITGAGIVSILYNETEQEWYISDGQHGGFVYREAGLTQVDKMFTGIINLVNAATTETTAYRYMGAAPLGLFASTGSGVLLYQSDILDQDMSALKTIETVEILGTLPTDAIIEVMIETRATRDVAFRATKWVTCNRSGACSPIVSGTEMRVNVRMSTWQNATIEGLRLWWKVIDRRYIRGRYDDNISYNRPGGS
jgi:hypothetical protein